MGIFGARSHFQIFVSFTQIYTNFVVFCLTPNFLVSGTFPNYFHPNLGLTPTSGGLPPILVFWALFCCFYILPLFFVVFTQTYINFVVFGLTLNVLVSETFPNYFHPILGLTPNFWGLTPNFSVLGNFLLFLYFTPNFRYLYPNLYQFRGFLSYPQLSSVWNLSQLFSSRFRPYPQLLGGYPEF